MILRRIALRHFRGVREAVFDNLSERLCLFYGPNESGKSTLVEALHFALFERAAGHAQHKRELQTWGGGEGPEVEVAFVDDAGEPWHVEKRFVVQPRTVLSGRNVVLHDEAAEVKLRAVFGTREGNNRGTSPSDLGIWPLLWVRQGQSGVPTKQALTVDAREALSSTLAAHTGAIAAGPVGLSLRARVAQIYASQWTSAGREQRELKAVLDAADAKARARDDLHERYLAAQGVADALARREVEVAALQGRVAAQHRLVVEATARAAAAASERRTLELVERDVKLARLRVEQAEKAHEERQATSEALAAATERHTRAVTALTEAERRHVQAQACRRVLREQADVAERDAALARRIVDRVQRRTERARLVAEHAEHTATIARAEEAERAIRTHADALAVLPIKRTDVERLEHLVQLAERARDRLEAASVRVVVTALRPVSIDGVAVDAGSITEIALTEARTLRIGDVAAIEILPGDTDAAGLAAQVARHEEDVARKLASLGVADLAEARRRLDRRLRLERQREEEAARLSVLARDGLHALREAVARLDARLAAIDAHDEALPDLDVAITTQEAAEAALVPAQAAARAHDDVVASAQAAVYEARSKVRREADEVERLRGRLDVLGDPVALAAEVEAARSAHTDVEGARQAHARALAAAGGDDAERTLTTAQQALQRLEVRRHEVADDVVRLQAALEARHDEGLYEAWQDAVAEAVVARSEAEGARRHAEACRVLHAAVEHAWLGLRDRFAGPVRDAVEDGVRILFPGSTLAIDDEGDVIGLRSRSGDVVETFDQLSGGAREQLGVLVRLGIARVLAGDRRLPVLLDDALVNSDAERRARMVEVLRRASAHLQLLVLTCHDEDFDRLAAPWQREVRGRPGRHASGLDA